MKTFLTICITSIVTWTATALFYGARTASERLWMASAVKAPGRMAITDLQNDMHAGRYELATAKVDALMTTWQRFSSDSDACRGSGIGDIMLIFSQISKESNVEPSEGANALPGEQLR